MEKNDKEFANQYKKNIYVCSVKGCNHSMITIDRDTGVTPFITSCPMCGGETRSSFYRIDQNYIPTHEWYRPTKEELETVLAWQNGILKEKGCPDKTRPHLLEATKNHVNQGGLLLRKIGERT